MASGQIERNTFIKGLITEASPINFPENASIDEQNFILNTDGTRQRRKGLNIEDDGGLVSMAEHHPAIGNTAYSQTFIWSGAGKDGTTNIAIFRMGRKLWFFNRENNNFANNSFQNALEPIFMTNLTKMDGTSLNGNFIFVNDLNKVIVVLSYDSNNNTVSASYINPAIRDIYGIDDGLDIDERPTTLSDTHKYNLKNQGWSDEKITAFGSPYPSNADQVHLGKTTTGTFDKKLIKGTEFGTTHSARGKNIINMFERGTFRDNKTGINIPNQDRERGNLSCITSGFGRLWYSGIVSDIIEPELTSPNYTGTVFFSRIAESELDYGKFYQEADPSAEIINELVSSDGGHVKIAEAGKVLKLVNINNTIIVFSGNGVWGISGSDGIFKANDFSVDKISDKGLLNTDSIVVADNQIFYWSIDGIYLLVSDRGRFQSQNITNGSIASLYSSIHKDSPQPSKGYLDKSTNTVHWLYRNNEWTTAGGGYDGELIFNLNINAWSKYKFYSAFASIVDVIEPEVLHNRNAKYCGLQYIQGWWYLRFLELKGGDFADQGNDAKAYLITGNELFQDTQRSKQVNYLSMHFMRTETGFAKLYNGNMKLIGGSSCIVTPNWGFSTQDCKSAKKYQTYKDRQLYTPNESGEAIFCKEVVTSKTRVRGRGVSFSMKIETEPYKDLHLLGWGLSVEGRRSV